MQLSTKKCLLTYSGAIMFAFGLGLLWEGDMYHRVNRGPLNFNTRAIVSAIPHWCGMLLLLLGARNFTFGLAQWKYGTNCCGGGTCEILFVNLMALIVSGCAVGFPVWSSLSVLQNASASTIATEPEFVYLISIWFMGLMCGILALLSMFAGCLPVHSGTDEEDEIEMQEYGHDNPQFSKY